MSGGGEEAAGLTELLHLGSEVSLAHASCFLLKLNEQRSILVWSVEPARVDSATLDVRGCSEDFFS